MIAKSRVKMKGLGIVLLLFAVVNGQAPGDAQEECLNSTVRPDTGGRTPLLASFDYFNLLGPGGSPPRPVGPWTEVDVDGTSPTWTQASSSCNRRVESCVGDELSGVQENWLITQYVNNSAGQEGILTSITFSILQCTGCQSSIDIFILQTSNTNQSFATDNRDLFVPLTTVTDTIRDGTTRTTATHLSSLDPTMYGGFYIAVREQGTCVGIHQLAVYISECGSSVPSSGIVFPRTAATGMRLDGNCIANSVTQSGGTTVNGQCQTDATWGMFTNGDSLCSCVGGYFFNDARQCEACPPFMFKHTVSNTALCMPCPANSNSSVSATPVCPCDSGFFRAAGEETLPCTRPPNAPSNLSAENVTTTSVYLSWIAATDNGDRSDLFYTISENVTNITFTTMNTNFRLEGLIPFVYYEIRVTADNGVSSQDLNVNARRITANIMTLEGTGGVISSTSVTTSGSVVSWSPPDPPQGTILMYEIIIFDSSGMELERSTTTDTSFNTNLEPGTYSVQLRSFTAVGPGNFTAMIPFEISGDSDSSNIAPIIGGVVGGIVAAIVIIVIIILLVCCCRNRRKMGGATVTYTKNSNASDENIVKKLPGVRKYVDPQNYATPESALKDFTCEIPAAQLRLDEVIGGGEFGDVCRGMWYKSGDSHQSVAIKTLKPGSPYNDRVNFLTEASIMGQFHHDNVITLHGVVTKTQPVMIVMEYMENKSLDVYLRKNDELLGALRLSKMAKGVAAGMEYFSEIGFVHRDLAARNVLVALDEVCKIADFGLSRETVDNAYDVKTGGKIPIRWTAPEAIQYRKFTSSSDVWSYGVLLWEIMSYGQQPYWDWSNHKVLEEVESGYRLEIPKDCPQSIYDLMLDCWNYDHRLRPTFTDIRNELDMLIKNNFKSNRNAPYQPGGENSPLDFDSVDKWLRSIKMERYIDQFVSNNFTKPQEVLGLTQADLVSMGITLAGHQNKILKSIQNASNQLQREPSYKI